MPHSFAVKTPGAVTAGYTRLPESSSSAASSSAQSSSAHSTNSKQQNPPIQDRIPGLSSRKESQFYEAKHTAERLNYLANTFPAKGITHEDYQQPIKLLEQKQNLLLASIDEPKSFFKTSDNSKNLKKNEKELQASMGGLFKKVNDTRFKSTDETARNRATNIADEMTKLGVKQTWLHEFGKK